MTNVFFFQYGSAKDIMCNVPLSKVIYRLQNFIGFAKYKQRIADDLCVCVLGKIRIQVNPDLLCLMVG